MGATSGSGAAIVQTLSTPGVISGTATYWINTSAKGCAGLPIKDTVTVNPCKHHHHHKEDGSNEVPIQDGLFTNLKVYTKIINLF